MTEWGDAPPARSSICSGPHRRLGGQRPRHPRDRPQDRVHRPAPEVRRRSTTSWPTSRQGLRREAESSKASVDLRRRPPAGPRTLVTAQARTFDLPLDWDALKTTGYDAKALLKRPLRRVRLPPASSTRSWTDAQSADPSPSGTPRTITATIDTPPRPSPSLRDRELEAQPRSSAWTRRPPASIPLERRDRRATRSAWKPRGRGITSPFAAPCSKPQARPAGGDARRPPPCRSPNPATEKIGQNIKYDLLVMGRAGLDGGRADHRHDGPVLPARKRRAEPRPGRPVAAVAGAHDDPDHVP